MTLFNITRHTNRRYECIASNGYPPDVGRSFQLTIHYPPELTLFINEEIISSILFMNSNHNEIRLKCQILMNPLDKIYWIKDNHKLHTNYQIYQIDNYIITELIIKHFTADDQGEYTCTASNSLGYSSKSIQILSLATTTTERSSTSKRKRPKYTRTTKFITTTTEYSRMMTLSSEGRIEMNLELSSIIYLLGVNHCYSILILFFSLFTVFYIN